MDLSKAIHNNPVSESDPKKYLPFKGVVFLPMPVPPKDESLYEEYVADLKELTFGLGPTLLVYGTRSLLTNDL